MRNVPTETTSWGLTRRGVSVSDATRHPGLSVIWTRSTSRRFELAAGLELFDPESPQPVLRLSVIKPRTSVFLARTFVFFRFAV